MANRVKAGFQDFSLILAVFCLAFAARFIAVLFIPPEFWEYETIARNVLAGRGFVFPHIGNVNYAAYCEPLYPGVCILVYFLTHHNVLILELVQAAFSSAIAVVIYLLADEIYGRRIGLLAGILVALHPGLIFYTTKLHPLIFDAFFISLSAFTLIKLLNNFNLRNIMITSIACGLCVLTRPTILVFLPFGLAYVFIRNRLPMRQAVAYIAVFGIIFSAVILPWGLRNYSRLGTFVLTRTNGPFVFWLGNNPNFTGSSMDKSGRSLLESAPREFREKIEGLDELGQNRSFLAEAFSYVKKYPWGFIARAAKKFYYFWWFSPQAGLLYPKAAFLAYRLMYLFIFIFSLCGIFRSFTAKHFKTRGGSMVLVLLLLSISIVQSLFYIETRHRLAVEPLVLIFTAAGIYRFYKKGDFLTEER